MSKKKRKKRGKRRTADRAVAPVAPRTVPDESTELVVAALDRLTRSCDRLVDELVADRRDRVALLDVVRRALESRPAYGTEVRRSRESPIGGRVIPSQLDLRDEVDGSPAFEPVLDADAPPEVQAVEVRSRFGHTWVGGFEVDGIVGGPDGMRYRVRRITDGRVLPMLFGERDVRIAGTDGDDPSVERRFGALHW